MIEKASRFLVNKLQVNKKRMAKNFSPFLLFPNFLPIFATEMSALISDLLFFFELFALILYTNDQIKNRREYAEKKFARERGLFCVYCLWVLVNHV